MVVEASWTEDSSSETIAGSGSGIASVWCACGWKPGAVRHKGKLVWMSWRTVKVYVDQVSLEKLA